MTKINLSAPQIDLLFQSYMLGMIVAHIPIFFEGIGLITLVFKFIFSLPVIFAIYFLYLWKCTQINSRPFFGAALVFTISLCLVVFIYFAMFYSENDFRLLYVFLILAAPSSLIACIYFAVRLWLRKKISDWPVEAKLK
ncbi:hypothetical protein AOG23_14030 [Rhizobium acidisoli]|nr:hypothetical protein AOG23_14030 [Rhizobium acidisoli]